MLDFLLPFVDIGFLVVQTAFAAVMVSTIKNQFQAKASTVTLVTSLTFFAGLITLSLFQVALGLPLAAASAFGSALLWGVVAGQRAAYRHSEPAGSEAVGRQPIEIGEEIPLCLTYSPVVYAIGSLVTRYDTDEVFRLTRVEELVPTQLPQGRQARCWQLYGRRVACADI